MFSPCSLQMSFVHGARSFSLAGQPRPSAPHWHFEVFIISTLSDTSNVFALSPDKTENVFKGKTKVVTSHFLIFNNTTRHSSLSREKLLCYNVEHAQYTAFNYTLSLCCVINSREKQASLIMKHNWMIFDAKIRHLHLNGRQTALCWNVFAACVAESN